MHKLDLAMNGATDVVRQFLIARLISKCHICRHYQAIWGMAGQSSSAEGYDTFENSIQDFKLLWFLISMPWFLISKLISDFQIDFWFLNWFLILRNSCHQPDTSNYTLSRPLFELLEAKVVITLEEFDPCKQGKPYSQPYFWYWLRATTVTSHLNLSSLTSRSEF